MTISTERLGGGELVASNEFIPGPSVPADLDGAPLPTIVFDIGSSNEASAATLQQDGEWYVWAGEKVKGTWQWARENRPQVTMGAKILASAVIAAGVVAQIANHESAGNAVQAAGNVMMSSVTVSDIGHYLHSGIVNFKNDPKESIYDVSKAACQAVALAVAFPNAIVPLFKGGVSVSSLNLVTAILVAAGSYATGPTATEKIKARRKENLGEYHQNLHLPSDRAPDSQSGPPFWASEAAGDTTHPYHDLNVTQLDHIKHFMENGAYQSAESEPVVRGYIEKCEQWTRARVQSSVSEIIRASSPRGIPGVRDMLPCYAASSSDPAGTRPAVSVTAHNRDRGLSGGKYPPKRV